MNYVFHTLSGDISFSTNSLWHTSERCNTTYIAKYCMKGICFQTPLALLHILEKYAHYRDTKDFYSIKYKSLPYWTSVFNSDKLDIEDLLFREGSLFCLPCCTEFLIGEDPLFSLPRSTHFLINCRSSCITWEKFTGVTPESPQIKYHHFTFPVILIAIMCAPV